MENFLLWFVGSVAAAFVGSFLGAYLKKKGENLATHEDLDKLVDQMKATTEATKAIESRIDDQLWNRQRQWEMRKEIFIEASQAVAKADAILARTVTAYLGGDGLREKIDGCEEFWFALANHSGSIMIVSKIKTIEAFSNLTQTFIATVSSLTPGEYHDAVARQKYDEFRTMIGTFYLAMREELGIVLSDPTITSQSSGSSAAPNPAP